MYNYFANDELMTPPTKRAAYSDRTSYLMAEMSRLAYFKFEGGNNVDEILTRVQELIPKGQDRTKLETMIKAVVSSSSPEQGRAILSAILKQKGFTLIETFCDPGTDAQAFLCVCHNRKMAVLAFRGTEPDLKDIKTDIKARLLLAEYNGKTALMHEGYFSQFTSISRDIEQALKRDEVNNEQLFITGHSLGGALAITAVKFLASDITGACYTFGSPPVGTKTFAHDIKTPIYRIVNHVDIVPRLPSPILVHVIGFVALLVNMVLKLFGGVISTVKDSAWYKNASQFLDDAQKYRQSGYESFLVGEGNKARLRYSVGPYDRIIWWVKQFAQLNPFGKEAKNVKLLTDHSIETYSKKLATWALQRTS